MNRTIVLICMIGPAFLILLTGCGTGAGQAISVLTVYDDRTMSCEQARTLSSGSNNTAGVDESIRRAAKSKWNWCEAIGGGSILPVGYFDTPAKVYEFKRLSFENHTDVSRLCLDVAAANFVFDVPPKNLAFKVQTTINGQVETFPCERFAYEMSQRALTVLVAPTHIPLLVDIDPVLVLATGVNPKLKGVPHRYYDEVKDTLQRALSDLGK